MHPTNNATVLRRWCGAKAQSAKQKKNQQWKIDDEACWTRWVTTRRGGGGGGIGGFIVAKTLLKVNDGNSLIKHYLLTEESGCDDEG